MHSISSLRAKPFLSGEEVTSHIENILLWIYVNINRSAENIYLFIYFQDLAFYINQTAENICVFIQIFLFYFYIYTGLLKTY